MEIQRNLFGEIEDKGLKNQIRARALRLRLEHDEGSLRYKAGHYTMQDVVKTLESGFNFFTGEPINIV